MAATKRRYAKKEFARRGIALFKKIRPGLPPEDEDKFIAIDIETGEYEVARNEMRACDRLEKRVPDPQIWLAQVATGYLDRFGGHGLRGRA
jgi:hypothetical protein